MKRVRAVFFLLVPALSLPLFAQGAAPLPDEVFSRPLTAETRPRFDRVCAALAEHRVIRGEFVQTKTLSRLGRSLVSRGTFAVDADRGMIWDTRVPYPSVMALGGDFIIQAGGGAVSRLDAGGNETFTRISQTMSAVFTGNARKLTEAFEVYFSESGGGWKLGLLPKDSSIRAFARAIVIQGDSVLRRMLLLEQSGDSILYELSNHAYSPALSADEASLFKP
ncbi:MAG: outer membrane lipoprotein carrier protein LolA [Treponema sp.]|nr:outer membrane lipoprotein carrier protein LolA [Treponema sp.]